MRGRLIGGALCLLVGALAIWYAGYRAADRDWRARWSMRDVRDARAAAEQQARSRSMERDRQRAVADLDARYMGEIADAKTKIADLERAVAAGQRRLRINATCDPVPGAASTPSLADDARARPTDAAGRNYFLLRQRIELARTQIEGLQEYIRNACHG